MSRNAQPATPPPDERTFSFTKTKLQNLPAGATRYDVHDASFKGLSVRVGTSGAKAFYFSRRVDGRFRRIKVGDFPRTTVEQARKQAERLNAQIVEGHDPSAERRARRQEMTLGDLWESYQENHAKQRSSEKTRRAEGYLFDRSFGKLRKQRLSEITPGKVKQLHADVGKTSQVSANRSIALLRRLYRYAARHHDHDGNPPTAAVEMYREHSRERFLLPHEMPIFLEACDAEGQPWSDFFRLCLFTGARRSNVQALRFADVDFTAKTWKIPASQAKAGRDITIPLSADALDILTRRREELGEGYVFPKLRGGEGHISQPQRPFDRIRKRAGLEDLRIHDLRRSAGSWLAAAGASLPQIGRALGHADARSTQVYARLDLSSVRESMDALGAAMNASTKENRNEQ